MKCHTYADDYLIENHRQKRDSEIFKAIRRQITNDAFSKGDEIAMKLKLDEEVVNFFPDLLSVELRNFAETLNESSELNTFMSGTVAEVSNHHRKEARDYFVKKMTSEIKKITNGKVLQSLVSSTTAIVFENENFDVREVRRLTLKE